LSITALAQLFHSIGAKVILSGRNGQKLQQVKFTLDAAGNHRPGGIVRYPPAVLEFDLTQSHAIQDHIQAALKLFGHIDLLINNAGVSSRSSALDTDIRVDRTIMETNFFGPIQLTKALLPALLEQGSGHIVVISSLQGKLGLPYRSSYSASKHALEGYFDALRVELYHRNIPVTIICPGYINTRLSVNALTGDGTSYGVTDTTTDRGMSPDAAAQKVLEAVALCEREAVISGSIDWLALYLKLVWPSGLDWILKKRAKIE
jgi:dehydrogenase/reductase SDR family protein 7B